LKQLQGQWKGVGYAGREHDQRLWDQFRHALDHFFERQNTHFGYKRREERENLHRKEALCDEARSLANSDDYRSATQRVKELQHEWKNIGHVPRECSESLWKRFQHACDEVFEHARREHERKQEDWREKMRDALARKREQAQRLRESIEHDEGNIERWQNVIDNLYPGGRADEIQSDLEIRIADVEDRIRSKRERVEQLEDSISDIESKLDE
jgi:chromosome segregation ATPase